MPTQHLTADVNIPADCAAPVVLLYVADDGTTEVVCVIDSSVGLLPGDPSSPHNAGDPNQWRAQRTDELRVRAENGRGKKPKDK
jgi:hypothetical protein